MENKEFEFVPLSLEPNEILRMVNHIQEFSKSGQFMDCMNDYGLEFTEMAVLMTWILEKTGETIKMIENKE